MRRRKQVNSKTNRKGKKLRGLTKFEGTQRAKKAWQTKHQRYQYSKRKFAAEDDFFEKAPKIEDPSLAARREVDKDYLWAKAHEYASGRELEHPDFKESLKKGPTSDAEFRKYIRSVSPAEQQSFLRMVQKAKEVEAARKARHSESSSVVRPDPDKPQKSKLTEEGRTKQPHVNVSGTVEPGAYGEAVVERLTLSKSRKEINKEPEVTPTGEFQKSPKNVYEAVKNAFSVKVQGEPRPRHLANTSDMSALASAIYYSHAGNSVQKRRAAKREAEKISSRMSVSAQHEYNKIQDEIEITSIAKDLGLMPESRLRKPAVEEKRLKSAVTPRELYEASGHTDKGFRNVLKQVAFHKQQAKNKTEAIKEGNLTTYIDSRGRITNKESSLLGVVANKEWKYRLARPPSERTVYNPHRIEKVEDLPSVEIHPGESKSVLRKRHPELNDEQLEAIHDVQQKAVFEHRLPYDDVSRSERFSGESRFHRGRRNPVTGDLYPNEWDQVLSETLDTKYDEIHLSDEYRKGQKKLTAFELGKRGLPQPEKLPEGIQRYQYIERPGIKEHVKGPTFYASKSEVQPQHQVMTADGKWVPVPKNVYDVVPEQARSVSYPKKKVQVMYVPQGSSKLLRAEKNAMYIRTPELHVPLPAGKKIAGEHLVKVNVDESSKGGKVFSTVVAGPARAREARKQAEIESVLEGNAHSALVKDSKAPYGSLEDERSLVDRLRANDKFKDEVKEELIKRNPEMSPEEADSHIKELVAVGATVAGFSARRRIRQGYIPTAVNKMVSPFGVTAMDVNDAYVRPLYEHASNVKYAVKHPLSSPSGELGGLQVSSIKYRKHFIDPDIRYARLLDYRGSQLDRIDNTLAAAKQAHSKTGIRGAVARWSSERALKTREYGHLDEVLKTTGIEAREAALSSQPKIRTREGDYVTGLGSHRKTYFAAQELAKKSERLGEKYVNFEHATGKKGAVFPKASRWKQGEFTGNEKGMLIAGAAIGTAVGAGYLYHRHQQKKLEEDQKVAFYNKLLPPKFTSPIATPGKPQVTRYIKVPKTAFTEELLLAGNEIPARVFVPMSKKQVALRPADKGYPKNAPIGRPSLRLTGEASSKGKARDAFLVDMQRASKGGKKQLGKDKRRKIKLFGHETPFYATIGNRSKVNLRGSNPNKLSQEDLDKVMWAHTRHDLTVEPDVKNFYKLAGRDVSKYEDKNELQKLNYQFGTREAAQFHERAQNIFTPTKSFVGTESPLIVSPGEAAQRADLVKEMMLAKNRQDKEAIKHAKDMLDAFDRGRR